MSTESVVKDRAALERFKEDHPELGSASKIAAINEDAFVQEYAPAFKDDLDQARLVHQTAVNITEKTALIWANIKDAVASPYIKGTRFNNIQIPQSFIDYLEQIPAYHKLFGSLDFIEYDHCRSIFGPAAYFVDLLRFVDKNITQHPANDIPPGHKLEERRPDLTDLRLDCRNAYDLLPYVDLVTEILEAIVRTEAMPDAYQVLEAADFPMNLPFNLPLAEIRSYLAQLKTSLPQIYQAFETDPPHKHSSITREFLELSPKEFSLITSEISDPTELTKYYGNVPLSGEDGLENVEVFLEQTGLSRQELNELVFQDLDRHEIDAGLSRLFFINNVDDGLGYLRIEQDPNQPLDPTYATERLVKLSHKKLDCIYRFLKLARKLGWSFIELDWALRSLQEPYLPENILKLDGSNDDPAYKLPSTPLDEAALHDLAAIKRLKEQYRLPMDKLCALWHSLKHSGREERQTLYDQIFNPVGVVTEPWPYYAAQPIVWDTTGQTDRPRDQRIRNRLMGALQLSHDDLNRLVAQLSGPEETIITLDGDYLATLYRLARLPGLLRMSVNEFLRLLALLGLETVRSLQELECLVDQTEWMRRTGIDVYELDFLTNDVHNERVLISYTEADILDLADDLTRQARDFLVKPDALVSPEIDQYQAKLIFDYLSENGFIDRLGAVTPKYSNPSDLASLAQKLEWETDFEALQDQLSDTLLRRQSELANTVLVGISGLVGVDPERLQPVLEYFKDEMDPARCLELLLAVPAGSPIPAELNNYLYKLNKILYLTGQFDLSVAETQALIKQPESFGVKQILNPDIKDLDNLYLFKELRTAFNDTTGQLIDLLAMPADDDTAMLEAIVALTNWEEQQLRSIMAHFDSAEPYNRPASLNRLKVCFDLAELLRVDVEFLIRLAQTDNLNFDFYQGQAAALLKVLRARYTNEQWPEIYKPIHNVLAVLKRDALISQAMLQVSAEYEGRKDPDILSEYLLLDVQTGSEVETSRLVQATAGVQLYVQRCLMNLEAGVRPESIPAKEWGWMKNYRVWEANRKVFLYPENYIEPELRDTKTPFFAALEQELLQNDINRQTAETAYTNYLDKFAEIANLKIVGSYLNLDSAGGGEEKILYLIGRTRTQPYSYYYRTCLNEKEWQPWLKIDLAIKADFVTPVYAFGKLFLFWPEFMKTVKAEPILATQKDKDQGKETVEEDGKEYLALQRVKLQENIDIYIPTIKYSFYNFSGKWIPPQDFLNLEGVTEDKYIRPEYQRVYAQRTLSSQSETEKVENVEVSLAMQQPILERERIILFFGNQIRSLRNNLEDQGFELTLQRPDAELANYDLDLSGSTLQLTLTNGLSYNDYADDDETTVSRFAPEQWQVLKERFPNLAEGTKIAGPKDELLHGLTRAETSLVDVNNQPGWYLLDSGDEQFLIKAQAEHRLKPVSERLKFEYGNKDGRRETDPQPISISFDTDQALEVGLEDLEPEYALNFNGVDDYIALPAMEPDAYNYTHGFTVEAWVRYHSFNWWSRIIDFGNGPDQDNILFANLGSTRDLTFQVKHGQTWSKLNAEAVLEANTWLHLAATVDTDGKAVLYKNGQQVACGQINAPKIERRTNNYIGRSNWPTGDYFDGDMREVRIWNVARSQAEIQATMDKPLEGGEAGLVGYWRFDKPYVEAGGIVEDQSGAGNHGRLRAEYALDFNGVDDYVTLCPMEADAYDYTDGFTVEAWVYYRSFKSWSRIIDFGNGPETNNILLANHGETNTLCLQVYPGPGTVTIDALGMLELNVWLHLAATVDRAGKAVLYKNGQQVACGQINAPKIERRTNNYIGRSNWPSDGYFDGDMREVRIWNVARSQADIQANMHELLSGDEPDLVGYWRFDKPYVEAGGIVEDRSGTDNHGQLNPEDALDFNGVDDYITLCPMEADAYDYTDGFTVEAWVRYHSFKKWSRIIDFGNGPGTNNILLANRLETNTLSFQVFPALKTHYINAPDTLELNVWLHLAATVDAAGNAVLYKNGQQVACGQINAPKIERRTNNYIGRSNWPSDDYFDGDMREVRIWNLARSQADIEANRNRSLSGNEAGLVGYWRFDKKCVEAGGIVEDQSGTDNHGQQLKRAEFVPWTYRMKYKPLKFALERLSTFAVHDLSQNLFTGGLDKLLNLESQQLEEVNFETKYRYNRELITPPNYDPSSDQIDYRLDFDGAYGLYYREIFFHIPFLIANQLNTNQRFAEAQKWYHYLFNPTTQESDDTSPENSQDRYWRFRPFRNVSLESLRQILLNEEALAAYRRDPFDPHAIARLRLNAYQKAVVMKYIDNLLDWGDYLFSQNTREAINEAVMLYILAYDLLGPRPKAKTVKQFAEIGSYADLKQAHGAEIPEFLVELAQQMGDSAAGAGAPNPHNNLITTFGVLENEQFIGYWDRVEDRLFKIRHSLTIEGVFRPLALFEPPISPMALVQAVAGGRDLGSVLSDLTVPVPPYRFAVMVDKAKEIVTTVIDLGQKLLAALVSKDAEQLGVLQTMHEKNILNLMTAIKESELAIAGETIEALKISKASIETRKRCYESLCAVGKTPREKHELNLYWSSMAFYGAAGLLKLTGGIWEAIPDIKIGTVGVGGSPEFTTTIKGKNYAAIITACGELADATAEALDAAAIATGRLAEYDRRQKEWEHEQEMAGKDLEEIDKQIAIAEMQRSIAGQQLALHHKTIQHNQEIADFYRTKFSNEALYTWLVGRLAGLYFQAYKLAYDLAKSAEKALQYELPTTESYISFGHWDSLKKGLLAGESLLLELNRMDKARLAQDSRFQDIEKTISLQEMMPGTLALLQATGQAEFQLSERLFDRDFPGHYCRLIKSVALSIKTDDGPLPEVHATLTQLGSKVLLEPDSGAVQYLLGVEGAEQPGPGLIRANWRANQQIAISRAVEDAGTFGQFDLNLLFDDRYFPFEGTGAISSWHLEIPPANNDFELSTINDVVIHLKYTAKVAGGPFKQAVTDMQANFESGVADDDSPPAGPSNGPEPEPPQEEQPAPSQPEKKQPDKERPKQDRSESDQPKQGQRKQDKGHSEQAKSRG